MIPFGGIAGSLTLRPSSSVVFSAPYFLSLYNPVYISGLRTKQLAGVKKSQQVKNTACGWISPLPVVGTFCPHAMALSLFNSQYVCWVSETPEMSYRTWRWQFSNRRLLLKAFKFQIASQYKGVFPSLSLALMSAPALRSFNHLLMAFLGCPIQGSLSIFVLGQTVIKNNPGRGSSSLCAEVLAFNCPHPCR